MDDAILRWRISRHQLTGEPAADAVAVARRVCGVHAKLATSATTAIGLRSTATAADVDTALWRTRTLVKTWAARGTLHLLPADEYWIWVAAMSTRTRESKGSWLRYHGVTADGMALILATLPAALGTDALTRDELTARIVKLTGRDELAEPLSHSWGAVLKPAAFKGLVCFGPSRGRNVTFVAPAAWLGRHERIDPDAAVDHLVRAYLDVYGPADAAEFSRWFDLNLPLARKAFQRVDPPAGDGHDGPPSVLLLPAFDPYVVGSLRQLDAVVAGPNKARVSRPQGWISPTLVVDGRIVGVWTGERRGDTLDVAVTPFIPLRRSVRAAVGAAAERVAAAGGAVRAEVSVAD